MGLRLTADLDALVREHLDFARRGAARHYWSSQRAMELEELESVACLGLLKALRSYDPAFGTTLRTWVFHNVNGYLRKAIQHHRQRRGARMVAWPRDAAGRPVEFASAEPSSEVRLLERERRALVLSVARTPRERRIVRRALRGETHAEIAALLGVSRQAVDQAIAKIVARARQRRRAEAAGVPFRYRGASATKSIEAKPAYERANQKAQPLRNHAA